MHLVHKREGESNRESIEALKVEYEAVWTLFTWQYRGERSFVQMLVRQANAAKERLKCMPIQN